jgi:hypothetical protein
MPLVPHVNSNTTITSAWGNLVADHVVMRFTTAGQRAAQLTAPIVNQMTTRDDRPGVIERWNGTAWVDIGGARELAYAEITVPRSVSATSEAGGDAVIASPGITLDGSTAVIIEIGSPAVVPPGATNSSIKCYLYQNGSGGGPSMGLGQVAIVQTPATGGEIAPVYAARRVTPPAGTYSWVWGAIVAGGGNGTIQAGPGTANSFAPAFIRVTRAL